MGGLPDLWPWDMAQDYFDAVWDMIHGWIEDVASIVWNITPDWLKDPIQALKDWIDGLWISVRDIIGWWDPVLGRFVGGFLGWLWDTLNLIGSMIAEAAGWVWEQVEPVVGGIVQGFGDLMNWIWTKLVDIGEWITGIIWGWVDGSLRWLTDTFRWLRDEVSETGGWIVDSVVTAFDGALGVLGEVFIGWPELLTGAISAIFEPLLVSLGAVIVGGSPYVAYYPAGVPGWEVPEVGWLEGVIGKGLEAGFRWFSEGLTWFTETAAAWLSDEVLTPLWEGLRWLWNWITLQAQDAFDAVTDLFRGFSSITPEDAYALAPKVLLAASGLGLAATGITSVAGIKVVGTGLEVGEIGSYIKDLLSPGMFVGATVGTLIGVGLTTPLRYHYQKAFTPLIPPIPDLIRFVVREVITPDQFYELVAYHGYSRERAEWFWGAHWILPAFGNVVDAYHRGIISAEELDKFLVWHDYSPAKRPGIEKTDVEIMRGVVKTLIPRVDLRYAWELGRLTDEELVEWYRKRGYEDDASLMAEIQMARALVEEIHKVRDEWIRAYLEGFILEETLRANLAAIGIGPTRIDYYVTYASRRREREAKKDWLDIYRRAYLDDLITDDDLDARAREILVDPEAIDIYLEKAYIQHFKKPPPPKPEKVRVATLAYLTRAFREDIITEGELRAELERRLYTPEDIKTIISVERMKKLKAAGE